MKITKLFFLIGSLLLIQLGVNQLPSQSREGPDCVYCFYDAAVMGSNPAPTGYNCYRVVNHQLVYEGSTTHCLTIGGGQVCHYWACALEWCPNCVEGDPNK